MFVQVNNSAVSQAPFQFIGEPHYSHQATGIYYLAISYITETVVKFNWLNL